MIPTPKFRIDSLRAHPTETGECTRCGQPAKHVLLIMFRAYRCENAATHKTPLCTDCLQKMLAEDSPMAAAAIAQLFEERNEERNNEGESTVTDVAV